MFLNGLVTDFHVTELSLFPICDDKMNQAKGKFY